MRKIGSSVTIRRLSSPTKAKSPESPSQSMTLIASAAMAGDEEDYAIASAGRRKRERPVAPPFPAPFSLITPFSTAPSRGRRRL